MFRIINIFLIIILLHSCYHENKAVVEEPKPLLTEEEMVIILTDIQLAEGALAYNRVHRIEYKEEYKDSIFKLIFDQHNINNKILVKNMNYYNANPEVMGEIYEQVLANLSKLQSEIEIENKKLDTLVDTEED